MKFICDKSNPVFAAWIERKMEVDKECDLEADFLKKRLDSLRKRKEEIWKEMFALGQKEGLIDKSMEYDGVTMQISDDSDQLFVGKTEDPFVSFLKKMESLK